MRKNANLLPILVGLMFSLYAYDINAEIISSIDTVHDEFFTGHVIYSNALPENDTTSDISINVGGTPSTPPNIWYHLFFVAIKDSSSSFEDMTEAPAYGYVNYTWVGEPNLLLYLGNFNWSSGTRTVAIGSKFYFQTSQGNFGKLLVSEIKLKPLPGYGGCCNIDGLDYLVLQWVLQTDGSRILESDTKVIGYELHSFPGNQPNLLPTNRPWKQLNGGGSYINAQAFDISGRRIIASTGSGIIFIRAFQKQGKKSSRRIFLEFPK